jgi:hypothetical protein
LKHEEDGLKKDRPLFYSLQFFMAY